MKRSMTIVVAGLLAAAAAAGAWHWHGDRQASRNAAAPLLAQAQRGDVEDLVSATGTLQPRDYVDVGAQVSGQLEKIHVEVGSVVAEGDLLAEIDSTLYRARVDATRASLENQRAQMLDRQAQLDLATLNYKRQKNLMAAEATTAEQLQTAEATLRSAKAQLAALQAQIRQSESTLRAEEAQLNYAKIYAPMSGTVVSITARQGQTLNTNQQAPVILQIADLSTMTVGLLGMAFKGESDDIRSSLSYKLKRLLRLKAARVLCSDPYVTVDDDLVPLDVVLEQADLLVIGAPHRAYSQLAPTVPVMDVWRIVPDGASR